jgi:GDP-L-fucose synthase
MNFDLKKDSKIYIAGHKGLIGSGFLRFFEKNGFTNIIIEDRNKLDLCSKTDTFDFFKRIQPEVVILAAGKVGGIIANRDFPSDFISENLSIQLNVFNAAHKYKVKKLIFFGSSCMYPKISSQPMSEYLIGSGQLEETSIAYATAKYSGVQMCQALNRQYNMTSFISVIPNSAYGPNDNFDLDSSHVIAALIHRFHEAKVLNMPYISLWGSGTPKREFVFVDDIVSACLQILKSKISMDMLPINIGVGKDISIKILAEKIKSIVDYSGEVKWDLTKPDGAPRKLLENSRIHSIGWRSKIDIDEGLKLTYEWFLKNIAN